MFFICRRVRYRVELVVFFVLQYTIETGEKKRHKTVQNETQERLFTYKPIPAVAVETDFIA